MKPKRLLIETVKQTNGDLKIVKIRQINCQSISRHKLVLAIKLSKMGCRLNAINLGKFLIKHSIHLTHILPANVNNPKTRKALISYLPLIYS